MTELSRDFYKDKASKMFGIPYDEVTDEQRARAKNAMFDYMYCRTDNYPLKDCLITAKLLEPKDSDNSLKNLYNKFIRNSGVEGTMTIQKMIEQGEVTIENSGDPLAQPYSSPFDYKGMWLKHYQ